MCHPVHQLTWHRVAWQIVSSPECRYSPQLQWSQTTLSFCMPFWKGLWQQLQVHLKSKLEGKWLILHPLRSVSSQYLFCCSQARGSGDVGEDPDHPHGRRHGRRQQARIHPGEISKSFFLLRSDLTQNSKLKFMDRLRCAAGSMWNGALRRGGAAPKKVAKGLIAFRCSLGERGREGIPYNFAKFQVTLEKICLNEGGRSPDSKLDKDSLKFEIWFSVL